MDCFRQRLRLFGLMLIVAILFPPSLASSTQPQGDIDTAIDDAIAISVLESDKNADALYRWMHPDAQQIVPKSAAVGWYTNDFFPLNPQPISEILDIQFISWTWPVTGKVYPNTAEIRFIQPFGSPGNVTYQEETVRLVEVDGQWRWFFGRSQEFVDEQIARFPDTSAMSRSSSTSNASTTSGSSRSSSSTSARSSSGCTLVELYPGYPGYRGVLTGMLVNWGGLGDWECLETLERVDPHFDKEEVDAANLAAARELGIDGQPADWVWENWMQIEAVQGKQPSCYSCVLSDPTIVPLNPSVRVDPGDARVLLGGWWQEGDYRVRAAAFMLSAPAMPNAQDLLRIMPQASDEYFELGPVYDFVTSTGGYSWVPDNAHPQDQVFLVTEAIYTASPYMPPPVMGAYLNFLHQLSRDWRGLVMTSSSPPPFREYLKENWTP